MLIDHHLLLEDLAMRASLSIPTIIKFANRQKISMKSKKKILINGFGFSLEEALDYLHHFKML
jgi:hypothetical protein